MFYKHVHKRRGLTRGLQPPKLGRDQFHSGKFSKKTIGNPGGKFTEHLQPPKILRPPTPMSMFRRLQFTFPEIAASGNVN